MNEAARRIFPIESLYSDLPFTIAEEAKTTTFPTFDELDYFVNEVPSHHDFPPAK